MSFTLNTEFKQFIKHNQYLWHVFTRKFPLPINIKCTTCSHYHLHINQFFACFMTTLNVPHSNLTQCNFISTISTKWKTIIDNIIVPPNTVYIWTDASLHLPQESENVIATGGIIYLTESSYFNQSVDLTTIDPRSSTRAEFATICHAVQEARYQFGQQCAIHIFTDSLGSISIFNDFKNNLLQRHKNICGDLIAQIASKLKNCSIYKIKGHDSTQPDSLNHFVDALSHNHYHTTPLNLILHSNHSHHHTKKVRGFRLHKIKGKTHNIVGLRTKMKLLHRDLMQFAIT
eukprot:NODE_848_length_3547_cov_0.613399.p2 type:complete len:288 gc:universal NODE_848_length_3547_cov_0.613399:932-69(-)